MPSGDKSHTQLVSTAYNLLSRKIPKISQFYFIIFVLKQHPAFIRILLKVSKGAKIKNRYNQVPHLTQDTNWKVTNSPLDITNESHEVNHFSAGDLKAHINRGDQRHSKHKTGKKNIKDSQKKPWNGQ